MSTVEPVAPGARVVAALLQGAAATATFSAFLSLAGVIGRGLGEPPPRRIVRTLLAHAGIRRVRRDTVNVLATLAHLGYGTSAALPFFALARDRRRRFALGLGYGALLWAISYAGWVPALGALPLPHRDRKGRQARMLLAHLVYGATLSTLPRLVERRRPRSE